VWTAILGMFAALIGFLGVVVGAVVTGFVTLRQARLATQREYDVRQIEWGQARKDVRDTFQRESIISLQDAISDTRTAIFRDYERKHAIWQTQSVAGRGPGEPLPEDWVEADARVNKLWARVFDDDLQGLVQEFRQASGFVITAQTRDDAFDRLQIVREQASEIDARVALLLRELY
jgi:hypothetical protein